MNKKKFRLSMLAACSLLAVYSLPAAADTGPYLAADLGQSHYSGGVFDSGVITFKDTSLNDTTSASRFTFGYQITPYWGIEAGLVNLGTGTVSYRDKPSMGSTDMGTYHIKTSGFFVAGTGTLPISEQWSLYARAGTFASTLNYDFDCNTGDCALFGHQQTSGAGATYGVGVKWNFLPHWSLRLGWDHYSNLGDASYAADSYKANLLSLGIEWHFHMLTGYKPVPEE